MDIYVGQEENNISGLIEKLIEEESWSVTDDAPNKVLTSSIHLMYPGAGQIFWKLFFVITGIPYAFFTKI